MKRTVPMLLLTLATLAPLASAQDGGCATTYAAQSQAHAGTYSADAVVIAGNVGTREGEAVAVLVEGVRVGTLIITYYGTFLNAVDYVQNLVPLGPFAATDQFFKAQLASTSEATGHYGRGVGGGYSGTINNVWATEGEATAASSTYLIAQRVATQDFVACAV